MYASRSRVVGSLLLYTDRNNFKINRIRGININLFSSIAILPPPPPISKHRQLNGNQSKSALFEL